MKYEKKYEYYVGDFETTVYKGQKFTEVWASAIVPLYSENVTIHHSIDETFDYLVTLTKTHKTNICIYYHNLKFDGSFWLDFLINKLKYTQAIQQVGKTQYQSEWLRDKDMSNHSIKYSISDMGQWYTILIKVGRYYIEFRDSLKLLPFSVKQIGNSFGTMHKKLEMEYKGLRYAGCTITDKEREYIANDVLVVKEALEIMFNDGHNKLTIGSCCMAEFKSQYDKEDWNTFFPDLYTIPLSENYGSLTAGDYIKRSYRGGWCYVVPEKTNHIFKRGTTADVNSLYPSMMSSESGNRYPVGEPNFWSGNYIPDKAIGDNKYYFVRIRTRFNIKDDYLPFIQIKNNYSYKGNECLKTSDIYNSDTGHYCKYIENANGEIELNRVTLTLTMTDFELIKEHYNLEDFEILDGCWFFSEIGIFDKYMEKYKQIKMNSKGAKRSLAKLYLNNLYGKFATNTNSSFKVAFTKEDGSLGFYCVRENKKKAGYIAIGSAITSYARSFTIRAAQKNYHGIDKPGFIYADTDSIHCDLEPADFIGVPVHPTDFCHWKLESSWDEGIFVRQKTYIEHVIAEDLQPISEPYYNIKCAGMPPACKNLFDLSMRKNKTKLDIEKYNKEEKEFILKDRTLNDFKAGLIVPSKLLPKRIRGGIVLEDCCYSMR